MSLEITENALLADHTTMRVGGPARFLCVVGSRAELLEALTFAKKQNLPRLILGGGSNLIPTDDGFDGLVIQLNNTDFVGNEADRTIVAGAGMPMSDLVSQTTQRGWQGLEWAGGLPGTLGGAVRGNAGAFGGEMKDSVVSVVTIDPDSDLDQTVDAAASQFAYRTSRFKTQPTIIWQVVLRFGSGDPSELARIAAEKIAYRRQRHPQEPSAGSIFQNLWVRDLPADFFDRFPALQAKVRGEKLPTGALLDVLGMKGRRSGGAMISERHANIIINPGNASATDVRTLAKQMKTAVNDHFGIELHEEPEFL